jgi:hypothetical protein
MSLKKNNQINPIKSSKPESILNKFNIEGWNKKKFNLKNLPK